MGPAYCPLAFACNAYADSAENDSGLVSFAYFAQNL